MNDEFLLRPYRVEDEDAAVMLWQRTWQQAYPSIDFAARVPWWRARWRNELVPNAAIIIAEHQGAPVGFVTIDASGYLDQVVVDPKHWGSDIAGRLVDEAKRISPQRITLLVNTDNLRAIRFYERNGFSHAGEDVNPTSGRPVLKMEWRATTSP
jgi:putative acetyltransferase